MKTIFENALTHALPFVLCLLLFCAATNAVAANGYSLGGEDLVAYWSLDEDDFDEGAITLLDRSRRGNHGNLAGFGGSSSYVPGRYGQALRFSGAGTAVEVAGREGLNLRPSNSYTYAMWVRPESLPQDFVTLIYQSAHQQLSLHKDHLLLRSGVEIPQLLVYGAPLGQVGRWYHLVATFDGAVQAIYVDGKPVGSNVVDGRVGGLSSLRIGGGEKVGFEGLLDDIRVYNRALNAEEILALYQTEHQDLPPLRVPIAAPKLIAKTAAIDRVELTWSPPEQSDDLVRLYMDDRLIAELGSDRTSFEVRHLRTDTEYLFQASAVSKELLEGPRSEAVLVKIPSVPLKNVEPFGYLASKTAPVFKKGHTLLPLTRWAWGLRAATAIEMARWGYALDFGDATPEALAKLADPNSRQARLVELARKEPEVYRLSVLIPRLPKEHIPTSVFVQDHAGNPTDTWSPEAPDAVLASLAQKVAGYLKELADQVPLAIVLNGGERFLGVPGHSRAIWSKDPRVVEAKGELQWSEYISKRKAHQERFFSDAVSAVTKAPYIWYYSGGNQYRAKRDSFWYEWDWDYRWMHTVSDYPNNEMYWRHFNTGWEADDRRNDLLSLALNAAGYAIKFDKPLAYNWLSAGWDRPTVSSGGFGDIERYYGFLKSLYMVGMLGGVAGYFNYPEGGFDKAFRIDRPPHWLQQIEALAQVHAEFSYLERFLREGDLLAGPDTNEKNPDQPAYDFYTGHANTRVLARRLRGEDEWLVSAWAADGVYRRVSVNIPDLGRIELEAYPAGSLYHARTTGSAKVIKAVDLGSRLPTPLRLLDASGIKAPAGLKIIQR